MGVVKSYLTELLKKDLKAKGLCVWLDSQSEYSEYVEESLVCDSFPYPVLMFKGSFLELMMQLAPHFAAKDNQPCLIHMPGFNQRSIKETPLLEAYKAGKELQFNLKTTVRHAAAGKLAPDQLNYLLDDPDFNLELADERLTEEDQTPDGLKRLISRHASTEIAIDLLKTQRLFDDLIELPVDQWFDTFFQYLHLQFGLNRKWLAHWDIKATPNDPLSALRIPLAAHFMSVEYVWDLQATPLFDALGSLKSISKNQHENCTRITVELRDRHADLYRSLASDIEPHLAAEFSQAPEHYGMIDTFAFEEERIMDLAFNQLENLAWAQVRNLAEQRLGIKQKGKVTPSFWVQQDETRRWVWQWLDMNAQLAGKLTDGMTIIGNWRPDRLQPSQMMSEYTEKLFQIDQCHRDFEQWTAHLKSLTNLAHFSQITRLTSARRAQYRGFINQLTKLFNQSCQQHGFLPPEEYRQRNFHEQVVTPSLSEGPTVLFYIDAFRYELGEALLKRLNEEKGEAKCTALLAELPTVTSVGMNALLPLSKSGQLNPLFDKRKGSFVGFRASEKQINGPKQRAKLLREHVGVPFHWTSLKDMSNKSPDEMKKNLNGKQFVVVHSLEIDELGEKGMLPLVPDYFEKTIGRLLTVVKRLQQVGFHRFIFTADHGFIQGDETVKGERIPHLDVETRRYGLHSMRLESSLVTSVSLTELCYQVEEPSWLLLSPTGDLFQKPESACRFYHGGNSLQERVIPVITYNKKKAKSYIDEVPYHFDIVKKPTVMGFHRIVLKATSAADEPGFFVLDKVLIQLDTPIGSDASITLADVSVGTKKGNQIEIPLDQDVEIFFSLKAKASTKIPLTISQPMATKIFNEVTTREYFEVQTNKHFADQDISPDVQAEVSWSEDIPKTFHAVLAHLNQHGAITEPALIKMLGGGSSGSRKARKFAAGIQKWLPRLPFDLEVEQTSEGKNYKKVS
jgi:hypothetical protein